MARWPVPIIVIVSFFSLPCILAGGGNSQGCGDIVYSGKGEGRITSPNYPQLYPNDTRCTWNVFASSDKILIFEFSSFALQSKSDYLTVSTYFKGYPNYLSNYYRLTGDDSSDSLPLGFHAKLEFTSGSEGQGTGFDIRFKSINYTGCGGGMLVGTKGAVSYPTNPPGYSVSQACSWTFIATHGDVIRLQLHLLSLHERFFNFTVYNGLTGSEGNPVDTIRFTGDDTPYWVHLRNYSRIAIVTDHPEETLELYMTFESLDSVSMAKECYDKGWYWCKQSLHCIENWRVCDNSRNCPLHGEDEKACSYTAVGILSSAETVGLCLSLALVVLFVVITISVVHSHRRSAPATRARRPARPNVTSGLRESSGNNLIYIQQTRLALHSDVRTGGDGLQNYTFTSGDDPPEYTSAADNASYVLERLPDYETACSSELTTSDKCSQNTSTVSL